MPELKNRASRMAIAAQPVSESGGMNELMAKLLAQQAVQQPAYIQPGEPPAKAWAPVINQLGSLLAGKRVAAEQGAKQNRMAELLSGMAQGREVTAPGPMVEGPTPEAGMGPGAPVQGPDVTSRVPYSEQEKLLMAAKIPELQGAVAQSLLADRKPADGFTLSPGGARYDASGKLIAMLPKDKTEDNTKKESQMFDDSSKLRNEFINQSKDFKQVRDSYERIYESAQNPSAAGDLALIFNYMKMLDPGSTVREGEFATAQNSAGVPERIQAQYNKIISGERLTDVTRSDFLTRSDSMYEAQLRGQEQLEDTYKSLASRNSLRPENVVIDYRAKGRRKDQPKPAGGGLSTDEAAELAQLRKELKK